MTNNTIYEIPRILFLDIDGPVIPIGCYFHDMMCSHERSVFSTTATGFIKEICKKTGAKIVTNSSHNYHDVGNHTLKDDLKLRGGIPEEYFHSDWRTKYPMIDPASDQFTVLDIRRMAAIDEWMRRNGEVDWIGFDDSKYTDSDRLYLVDFNEGITYKHFLAVCERWGVDKPKLIV